MRGHYGLSVIGQASPPAEEHVQRVQLRGVSVLGGLSLGMLAYAGWSLAKGIDTGIEEAVKLWRKR